MNLYEINTKLANYHMEFDELTGEWINEAELDALQMAKDEKVENLCLWVKNLKAEANAIKTEEQNLADRRKLIEKKADRLEKYIASALGNEPFSTPRVAVTFRKSTSVDIKDEYLVPDRFMSVSVVRKPIKANIKKYLEELEAKEESVPWAKLDRKYNMAIK